MREKNNQFRNEFFRKATRIILTIMLVAVFLGAIIVTKNRDGNKLLIMEKEAKIEDLKRQIEEEDNRNKSLKEKQNYVPYKEYIEDIARNELGLIKENELILRPNKKNK